MRRPAWPTELLLEEMPGTTAAQLAPLLAALCYQFKTGAAGSVRSEEWEVEGARGGEGRGGGGNMQEGDGRGSYLGSSTY